MSQSTPEILRFQPTPPFNFPLQSLQTCLTYVQFPIETSNKKVNEIIDCKCIRIGRNRFMKNKLN